MKPGSNHLGFLLNSPNSSFRLRAPHNNPWCHPPLDSVVTNAAPRPHPSTSSDMTLLLTTQHYQDRRFFIARSSAVKYDFVAATVHTGNVLISLQTFASL